MNGRDVVTSMMPKPQLAIVRAAVWPQYTCAPTRRVPGWRPASGAAHSLPLRAPPWPRSMTRGDGRERRPRPRGNDATATSLAAFSTTGQRWPPASSARYARRRHGNRSWSGASKSSRRARGRSSGGSGASHRSGYENAYWIGSRMSVTPSCAMIEPSISSTIEWTIDCGWMTHVDPVGRHAEQPVRLDHLEALVHQRRRVDGDLAAHPPRRMAAARRPAVTSASARRDRPRNGPPDAVRISRRTSAGSRPCRHWWMALCSLSTGRIGDAAARAPPPSRAAGHHQHFLVGERDRLARVDRGQHRLEAGGARRGAQHDVDVGMRGDGDQAVASGSPRRRRSAARIARSRSIAAPWPSPRRAAGSAATCSASSSAFSPAASADDLRARRDARRPRPARSGRSSRSSREWRGASCTTHRHLRTA